MNRNVIRAFALGIITGSFLTSGIVLLSAPAKADPTVAQGERVICLLLDQNPSFQGIVQTAIVIEQRTGASDYEAGQMIALSVYDQCPEYIPLVKAFVNEYAEFDQFSAAPALHLAIDLAAFEYVADDIARWRESTR